MTGETPKSDGTTPDQPKLKNPAMDIAWKRNIELLPKLAAWFHGALTLQAGAVFLLAGVFVPADLRASAWVWLPGLIAAVAGGISIKTKSGFVLLGLGVGLVATAAFFAVADSRNTWFWAIVSLAVIYGLRGIFRTVNAMSKLNELAEEASSLGCQIILFRPFDPRYARWASNTVLPILDGYGEITHVSDKNFASAKSFSAWRLSYDTGSGEQSEESDTEDTPSNETEASATAAAGIEGEVFMNSEWMDRVEQLIESIDIAVIDVSVFAKSINWELEKSLARLPPERIILVAHVEGIPDLQTKWDTITETYRSAGITNPEDMRVVPYAPWQSPEFALRLHERMKQISGGTTSN